MGVFQSSVTYVCCNPFVWRDLISLRYPVTSPLVVDSLIDLGLGCSGLALGACTKELLVLCKLLDTWGSRVAPCASPTALQLSLDPFASRGDESCHRGILLLELVLCLELREVVLYRENTCF